MYYSCFIQIRNSKKFSESPGSVYKQVLSKFRYNYFLVCIFTINTESSIQTLTFFHLHNLAKAYNQKSNSCKQIWPLDVSGHSFNLCSSLCWELCFELESRFDWTVGDLLGADVSPELESYPKIKINPNFRLWQMIKL